MIPQLPADVWDFCILPRHGPLSMATDVERVAAMRIQRWFRRVRPIMRHGGLVQYRFFNNGVWRTGHWVSFARDACAIARAERPLSYIFMPYARVYLRAPLFRA